MEPTIAPRELLSPKDKAVLKNELIDKTFLAEYDPANQDKLMIPNPFNKKTDGKLSNFPLKIALKFENHVKILLCDELTFEDRKIYLRINKEKLPQKQRNSYNIKILLSDEDEKRYYKDRNSLVKYFSDPKNQIVRCIGYNVLVTNFKVETDLEVHYFKVQLTLQKLNEKPIVCKSIFLQKDGNYLAFLIDKNLDKDTDYKLINLFEPKVQKSKNISSDETIHSSLSSSTNLSSNYLLPLTIVNIVLTLAMLILSILLYLKSAK
jgi:hypothetical protein